MTIEFRCPECQKLLRTSDDKAGVMAKCPQCGTEISVPAANEYTGTAAAAMPPEPVAGTEAPAPESAAGMRPCPMCGEQVREGATRCRFCGESLQNSLRPPGTLEIGSVLSRSWAIFKGDMGTTMGVVLLPTFIVLVAYYAVAIGMVLVMTALGMNMMMGPVGGNANPAMFVVMQAVQNGVLSFVMCGLMSLLMPGMYQCLLRIARGERVDIGDVFRGGPYISRFFLSAIMMSVLYWIISIVTMYPLTFAFLQQAGNANPNPALLVGTGVLYFAGLIVVIMIQLATWPFAFVLVDRDPPGVQCVFQSIPLTKGSRLATFVLGIIATLLFVGGCVAACVGLLFVLPLVMLMMAVMYCDLTGQATAA